MMTMKKTLQGIVLGVGLGIAALLGPDVKAEEPKPATEVCATLEEAVSNDETLRTRLYTDLVYIGDIAVAYHGMNQIDDADGTTYFGKQVFTASAPGAKTMPVLVIKNTKGEIVDLKIGVRDAALLEKAGLYGNVDVTADKEGGNVTVFAGKELPKGWTVELYQDTELPFHGKPTHYTEIQANKKLNDATSAFVRAELTDFKEAKYLAGFAFRF